MTHRLRWAGLDLALAVVAALALGLLVGRLWPIGSAICVPVPAVAFPAPPGR